MTTFAQAPAPARVQPLYEVRDLAVSFGARSGERIQAVDGLDLAIFPRQTLALVGESGCGKSVTALATLQLIECPPGRVDRGQIIFENQDLLKYSGRRMLSVRGRKIAMIFQEPMTSLNPVLTIGDQLVESIRLHQHVQRHEAVSIAEQALTDVGIGDPRRRMGSYPHEFSGGMRQRVMIAMALACQPRLLLADEPTTSLDVTIQRQILDLLHEIREERDMAIMLITHDLGVVAQHADVVCVMYAGRVIEYARVDALFDKSYHPYTRGLLGSIPKLPGRSPRLTTVADVLDAPGAFEGLPGHGLGIVPWWPGRTPPDDLAEDSREGAASPYSLYEIEPGHWVGCWRTRYLADHPPSRPMIDWRR